MSCRSFFTSTARAIAFTGLPPSDRRVDWMRSNPRVCVEMDDVADQTHWTTILVFGRFEEVGDSAPDDIARRRALHLFQQRPNWWLPGVAKREGGSEHHSAVIYRIQIERVSGRRASRTSA